MKSNGTLTKAEQKEHDAIHALALEMYYDDPKSQVITQTRAYVNEVGKRLSAIASANVNSPDYTELHSMVDAFYDAYCQYVSHGGGWINACMAFSEGRRAKKKDTQAIIPRPLPVNQLTDNVKARQKVCLRCSKDFVGTRNDAKYCSHTCRQLAYKQRITVTEKSAQQIPVNPLTDNQA